MTSYLIHKAAAPITADEICAELGINANHFGLLIETVIAMQAAWSAKAVSPVTWALTDGVDIEQRAAKIGIVVKIGPAYQLGTEIVRDCVFSADPEAVKALRANVLAWCRNTDDRALAQAVAEAEHVKSLAVEVV